MSKRIIAILGATAFLAAAAAQVSAQDVLLNSAETIKVENFKLALFPTVLFSKGDSDALWGVAGRAGYGFTPRFDVEIKGAVFKDLTYFGAEAEYWIVNEGSIYLSAALGGHILNHETARDYAGIDASLLLSTAPVNRLEFYGGLKLAFDSLEDSDRNVTRVHLVPGIEYAISSELDFLAEIGIGLNDDSRSYASVGFAFYIR